MTSQRFKTLATMALLVIACHLLPATLLRAEESFAATHVCQLGVISDVSGPAANPGLAIFRVDRSSLVGEYRITLASMGSPYTLLMVSRRTGPDSYQLLQEIPWPAGRVTYKGTLQLVVPQMLETLDSGNLYLEARTEAHPEGFLRGQIEQIPNGIGFNVLGSNQTPPTNSTGEGSARLYYDQATGSIRYLVTWRYLPGGATSVSFRRGGVGVSGPVAHTLVFTPGDSSVIGTWEGVTAADLDALATGNIYLNIATAKYPDGEIRGQLLPIRVFTAAVEPANEVPPLENSGPSGSGVLSVVGAPNPQLDNYYVTATVVVGGAPDSITGAYVGNAPIGVKGSVLFTLPHSFDSTYRRQRNITAGGTPGYATVDSIRAELTYVDFQTVGHPEGALRGQWIASENNLPATASVPVAPRKAPAVFLAARYSQGVIDFQADGASSRSGQIRLYSTLGQMIGSVAFDGTSARMEVTAIAAGAYFAELVIGGVRVASAPVLVR